MFVWCMMFWGHLPDRYTGTLQNCLRRACVHCECLRLADWPPGQSERIKRTTFLGRTGGWFGAGTNVAVDWMDYLGWGGGGVIHLCCPPWWQCGDGARWKCLPILVGWGLLKFLKLWGGRPETEPPPPHTTTTTWSLYDRSFFGVFGAATKCAMCYVAWFIIFFYKLQSSFVVQLY